MRKGFDGMLEKELRWGRDAQLIREGKVDELFRTRNSGAVSPDERTVRPMRGSRLGRDAARRRNAQKSTGPRTAEGKRRVSLNAAKWRLCSKARQRLMALEGQDPFEYRRLHRQLIYWFEPADRYAENLVADLAENWWQKLGAYRGPMDSRLRGNDKPTMDSRLRGNARGGAARDSASRDAARELDWRIENDLDRLLGMLASQSRQWNYVLRQRVPTDFDFSRPATHVRHELESRLMDLGIGNRQRRAPPTEWIPHAGWGGNDERLGEKG